jgi:hypothetical protein
MESSPTTPPSDADVPVSLGQLSVLLISEEDGEDSIVDLTKTLTEMAQRSKITPKDITVDLVDAELSESVMSGPELLILFGPTIASPRSIMCRITRELDTKCFSAPCIITQMRRCVLADR